MSVELDPWVRCSPADRRIIEGMQGKREPIAVDEVLWALRHNYAARGDQLAVVDGQRRWTYAELGSRVGQIAGALVAGSVFGVAIDRSAELVAAAHAVVLSGNAYTPLSLADPPAWRQTVLDRSGATAVLTAGDVPGLAPAIDQIDVRRASVVDHQRWPSDVAADAVSQVIFTSGSTGEPKGVICTHLGFANRIAWMQQEFALTSADRVALKTPFTFDVAGWELFWPQYAGATTVVVPAGQHSSPEALISIFNEYGVTVAHFVPSMLRMWLRADGGRRCPGLRLVFCSGEALTPDLVMEFYRQSSARLHNLYGPTEASIDVTHFSPSVGPCHEVPIGRPITNTDIYIVAADETVCPIGEIGEIVIHGIGVAAGYLGAGPDTGRFAPLSWLPLRDSFRTFRTGDFGRYTADGQIEFRGRHDEQVKIRGQRIELGEVTTALRAHDLVVDAYATTYLSSSGRHCLAAYVVLDTDQPEADPVGRLVKHVTRTLPTRAVPARIVVLDKLPVGGHGKVERALLPTPSRRRPELAHPLTAPEGPLETLVAAIWAQVLDLDDVGRDDDFHDLGGDSLAAVEIWFLLAERLGLDNDSELVLDMIMNGDTVANTARIALLGGVDPGRI